MIISSSTSGQHDAGTSSPSISKTWGTSSGGDYVLWGITSVLWVDVLGAGGTQTTTTNSGLTYEKSANCSASTFINNSLSVGVRVTGSPVNCVSK